MPPLFILQLNIVPSIMDSEHRIRLLVVGNPKCVTVDFLSSFCCVLLSWEHNWSVLFSLFVLGFSRNMGSVPHGCNSRCFCVRGICGSAARNPQDKDGRYSGETINPGKNQILRNSHSVTLKKGVQSGTRSCPKKKKKRKAHQRDSLPTPPAAFQVPCFLHPARLPPDHSEIKTDW